VVLTFQSMAVEIKVFDDLWAEEGENVGSARESEARYNLLGDRRTANQMTLLQHAHFLPRLHHNNEPSQTQF